MWQSQSNEEVVALGCDKILRIIEDDERKQVEAMRGGAMHPVRAAMERHPKSNDLMSVGKKLLHLMKLAEKKEIQQLIRDMISQERSKGTNFFGFNIRRVKR